MAFSKSVLTRILLSSLFLHTTQWCYFGKMIAKMPYAEETLNCNVSDSYSWFYEIIILTIHSIKYLVYRQIKIWALAADYSHYLPT